MRKKYFGDLAQESCRSSVINKVQRAAVCYLLASLFVDLVTCGLETAGEAAIPPMSGVLGFRRKH